MEYTNEQTRRLSLEDDFMKWDTDDLLFGAMQHLATFHPTIKRLYLTKKNYAKQRKDLANLCGITTRELKRHLDKLINKGLVKEEEILVVDTKVECYVFPYEYNGKYQIVNNEMLWYVVSTRNRQAVRVYITLLNWYQWKQKTNETYVFTIKEIIEKMGYSANNTLLYEMVGNILESFQREGVIQFADFYEEIILDSGKAIQKPQKRLLFVASTKEEMR